MGGDLFFDDEDVFCVNVESFDVLYIRDKEILQSILRGGEWTIDDRADMESGPCFISNVMWPDIRPFAAATYLVRYLTIAIEGTT